MQQPLLYIITSGKIDNAQEKEEKLDQIFKMKNSSLSLYIHQLYQSFSSTQSDVLNFIQRRILSTY